jgi:hypothetical protein
MTHEEILEEFRLAEDFVKKVEAEPSVSSEDRQTISRIKVLIDEARAKIRADDEAVMEKVFNCLTKVL